MGKYLHAVFDGVTLKIRKFVLKKEANKVKILEKAPFLGDLARCRCVHWQSETEPIPVGSTTITIIQTTKASEKERDTKFGIYSNS